jgi:Na+/H+ antiporter NhaA
MIVLGVANSAIGGAFTNMWGTSIMIGIVDHAFSLSLHQYINDGSRA